MSKEYGDIVEKKKEVFQQQTQSKKALFNTLITSYGAKKTPYFLQYIDQELNMNDLFID